MTAGEIYDKYKSKLETALTQKVLYNGLELNIKPTGVIYDILFQAIREAKKGN